MIVVRTELQAKFGYGSVLSGMIAEAIESLTGYEELRGIRWRVLSRTDREFRHGHTRSRIRESTQLGYVASDRLFGTGIRRSDERGAGDHGLSSSSF